LSKNAIKTSLAPLWKRIHAISALLLGIMADASAIGIAHSYREEAMAKIQ
jgi:hypothetical protein